MGRSITAAGSLPAAFGWGAFCSSGAWLADPFAAGAVGFAQGTTLAEGTTTAAGRPDVPATFSGRTGLDSSINGAGSTPAGRATGSVASSGAAACAAGAARGASGACFVGAANVAGLTLTGWSGAPELSAAGAAVTSWTRA